MTKKCFARKKDREKRSDRGLNFLYSQIFMIFRELKNVLL